MRFPHNISHRTLFPFLIAVGVLSGCSSDASSPGRPSDSTGGSDGGPSSASGGTDGSSGGNATGAGGSSASAAGGASGGAMGESGGASDGSGGATSGSGGAPSGGDGEPAAGSATELVDSWTLGWNLGNSLDVPEGETAWGNPTITASLLEAVAAAGFDVVRVPVTWSLHMGAAPDYTLDAAFLDRVGEVVGYVNAAGMDAIINLHHDGADAYDGVEWLSLNDESGAITTANNQAVEDRFVKVWTQIAARFKDYGSGLLFESMNEVHDGYGEPDPQYYSIINNLNQKFVDLVRASEGENATRFLVVPGYNTNIDYTLAGFTKPNDVTNDHLILSVHYYDPYTFALDRTTKTWGAASPGTDDWGQEDYVVGQFDKLKTRFIDQGLPMIMGEYGASNTAGYADYRRYYMEYVTKAAKDRGIVPIYWDNGGISEQGDNFGLFDRSDNSVAFPTIVDAMMRAATDDYALTDVALPTP